MRRKRVGQAHPFRRFCVMSLLVVLALLVGHGAGGLAGGLARGLALAAAAISRALLQGSAVQGLDVSHGFLPPIQKCFFIIPRYFENFNTFIFSTFPVTSEAADA